MMLATYGLHKLGLRLSLDGAVLEIGARRITIREGWARYRDGNRELVGCLTLPDATLFEAGSVILVVRGHRFRLSMLNAIPEAQGRWSFLCTDHPARLTPRAAFSSEPSRKPTLIS